MFPYYRSVYHISRYYELLLKCCIRACCVRHWPYKRKRISWCINKINVESHSIRRLRNPIIHLHLRKWVGWYIKDHPCCFPRRNISSYKEYTGIIWTKLIISNYRGRESLASYNSSINQRKLAHVVSYTRRWNSNKIGFLIGEF